MDDSKLESLINFIDMDKKQNINSTWLTLKDLTGDEKIGEIFKELKFFNNIIFLNLYL